MRQAVRQCLSGAPSRQTVGRIRQQAGDRARLRGRTHGEAVLKVFVTGATGVLGRRVVDLLVDEGDLVFAIARSSAKADDLRAAGAQPVVVSLFDPGALADAFAGIDAVLNLATAIPPAAKAARKRAWDENHRIRTVGSVAVATAAAKAGVQRLVQESLAFAYADGGDHWLDEDSRLDVPNHGVGILEAEAAIDRFRADGGGTGVVLRFGNFQAGDAAHTIDQISLAARGLLPLFGDDDAWWPLVHVDDAATAVVAALGGPGGVFNVAAQPATRQQIASAFAEAVGRRRVRRPPSVVARLGRSAGRMLARSERVSSGRFRDATGWHPEHDDVASILRDCVLRSEEPA